MNNIIRFEIAKINRGKDRICTCEKPHYEIDTVNRLVTCEDCGAVMDAFDVLVRFAKNMERIEQRQEQMEHQWKSYAKMANEEFYRMIRNRVFREMNANYRRGMLPHCPKCEEMFEPTEITRWTNKKYYNESERDEK